MQNDAVTMTCVRRQNNQSGIHGAGMQEAECMQRSRLTEELAKKQTSEHMDMERSGQTIHG